MNIKTVIINSALLALAACGVPQEQTTSSSSSSSSPSSTSSLSSSSSSSASIPAGSNIVYAVNAGGGAATLNNVQYQADRFSNGGSAGTSTDPINGVNEDALYQSERYGTYKYEIPVTNSSYSVKLHFAELYQEASGSRQFSVSVEGEPVIQNLDLYAEVGTDSAYDAIVPTVLVADESLTIELSAEIDNATISGFAIYSNTGGLYVEPPEPSCTVEDRALPKSISYNQAVTRAEQQNPPSGAFGYAIEHATTTLPNHTLYRPDLSLADNIPIVVWGNGGCGNSGTEQADFLLEIASHGYLVIANGGPNGSGNNDGHETELVKAIDWAIAENNRSCSPLYGKLNTDKIATMGWSCGGGMAHYAAIDPRVDTAVALNSGIAIYGDRFDYYPKFHSPVAIFNGDSSDVAYSPGLQEYDEVTNVPIYHANYPQGHGDAYYQDNGGEFGIVAVGWLNYMLKDDISESGKAMFFGDNCRLCRQPWTMKNKGF